MKKTPLILCLLLLPLSMFGQQVISEQSLSSQRWRHSSVRSAPLYSIGSQTVNPEWGGVKSVSYMPSVSSKSGEMASEIYTPFTENVRSTVSRRRVDNDDDDDDELPGVTPGDPGTQSNQFPIGDGWIMLLLAAGWSVIIKKRESKA